MKLRLALLVLATAAGTAWARNVECFGRTANRERVQVSLTKASKYVIGSPSVLFDDRMVSHRAEDVGYDPEYKPAPRYSGYQRYEINGHSSRLNLLLPQKKSGEFTGYLEIEIETSQADTVRLRCEQI